MALHCKATIIRDTLNSTFYKSRWTNEKEHSEKLIVAFSFKYKNYQENIRNEQIDRAKTFIYDKTNMIDKKSQNDCKRFIKKTSVTSDGEVAKKNLYDFDEEKIREEAKYDGFYAITLFLFLNFQPQFSNLNFQTSIFKLITSCNLHSTCCIISICFMEVLSYNFFPILL